MVVHYPKRTLVRCAEEGVAGYCLLLSTVCFIIQQCAGGVEGLAGIAAEAVCCLGDTASCTRLGWVMLGKSSFRIENFAGGAESSEPVLQQKPCKLS